MLPPTVFYGDMMRIEWGYNLPFDWNMIGIYLYNHLGHTTNITNQPCILYPCMISGSSGEKPPIDAEGLVFMP